MTVFDRESLSKSELTRIIKDKALELGYSAVGVTTADPFEGYREEMESRPGYEGWLVNPMGPYAGANPKDVMDTAKSIICAVFDFSKTSYPEILSQSVGRVYLGRGYVPKPESVNGYRRVKLVEFLNDLGIQVDDSGHYRIPDRYVGARAGVVTYGSNNLAYTEEGGSLIVLNSFMIDIELDYDEPTLERPCPPDCNKCVEACPTGALYEAGKLCAANCRLSRQIFPFPIEEEFREKLGLSIHGCDRCQEVCPRNAQVLENATQVDPFLERLAEEFDLEKVLLLDDAYYERVVYPIMYNYTDVYWVFQRNAAIAIGNSGDKSYLPALGKAKDVCPPEVQEYIDWALERLS